MTESDNSARVSPSETPAPATVTLPEQSVDAAEKASEAMVFVALTDVIDPEIGIDIVSLGLVYSAEVDDSGQCVVNMTLTSPYCPMGSIIQGQAHAVCMPLPGVDSVRVNLVWSPPWDPRTMASDEAKLQLGIY